MAQQHEVHRADRRRRPPCAPRRAAPRTAQTPARPSLAAMCTPPCHRRASPPARPGRTPPVRALLVQLVEILRVLIQLAAVRRDLGPGLDPLLELLRLALGEDRKAELAAAQPRAELLEVERPRIPLLRRQVVVPDVTRVALALLVRVRHRVPALLATATTAGTRRAGSAGASGARATAPPATASAPCCR